MVFLDYRMDPRRQRQRMTRRKVRPIIGIQWSSMRGSFGAVANETSRSIIWKKRCFSKESLTRVLRGRSVGDSVKTLSIIVTDSCIFGTGERVSGLQLPFSMSLWTIYYRVELIVAVRHHSSHDVHASHLIGVHSDHSPRQVSIAHCAVLV